LPGEEVKEEHMSEAKWGTVVQIAGYRKERVSKGTEK